MSIDDLSRSRLPLLDPDQLRSFVAIAETGNLTRAAEAVFRTPSAISMQVKKLEEALETKVLFRTSREVSLTPDGEQFLAYARRLLALNREAVLQFRKPELEGVVRIGAPDDYGVRLLPNVLRRFAECYPGVRLDVIIDMSVELMKRFRREELDLTLTTCGNIIDLPPGSNVVLEERLIWAGLKGGCAHQRRPLPVSMWEQDCPWRGNAVQALERIGIPYRSAFISAHSAGQRAALLADLAVAPFPASLVDGPLVELTEAETGLPSLGTYQVALSRQDNLGEAGQVAADELIREFREMPGNLLPQ
uniref:LysR family transcriptional regulator n=1 Tax=Pararhizobium sp. IMCC3301 TaxID=3067904 RepID=UPI00274156AC|nr:LysR family transcriptional regulator [Pararhizobium sp. IMCC3301]